MKFKAILTRKMSIQGQPLEALPGNAMHPLMAVEVLSKVDAGSEPGSMLVLAAALKAANLPDVAQITDGGQGFGGIIVLDTKGNPVPFKVSRVIHRLGYGFIAKDPAQDFYYTPLNGGSLSSASNFLDKDLFIRDLRLSGRYLRPGLGFPYAGLNSEITLEDDSYVSPQGAFSDVPGLSTKERIMPNSSPWDPINNDNEFTGYDQLITTVETLSPTNISASNGVAGRMVGGMYNPVNSQAYGVAPLVGCIPISSAFLTSQYEIEIDDRTVSLANETNNSIYLVACGNKFCTIKYAPIDGTPLGTSDIISMNTNIKVNVIPDLTWLAVKLTNLTGTTYRMVNYFWNPSIVDPANAPLAGFSMNGASYLGAGVNVGNMDYIPNT